MTKTMREYIINGIITTVGSIVVALTVSFFVFKRDNNVILIKEVEALKIEKADKKELQDFRVENAKMHELEKRDMKEYFDTRFDDLKEFMIELNKRK